MEPKSVLRASAAVFQASPRPKPYSSPHRRSKPPPPPSAPKVSLALASFHFVFSPHSAYATCRLGELLKLSVDDFWNDTVVVEYCAAYDLACPLCLDVVRLGQALPCGHVFCQVCIQRCLKFAAEENPMLYKCPVCQEGQLYGKLLRKCVVRTAPLAEEFVLVHALLDDDLVPVAGLSPLAASSRFKVASGESMVQFVLERRMHLQGAREDLQRFRDKDGLLALKLVDLELDSLLIEWNRLLGKARPTTPAPKPSEAYFYQNADGLMRFLHPVNLKCLDATGERPGSIAGLPVLEVNEWTLSPQRRIPALQCVAATSVFVELDLARLGLPPSAVEASRKEAAERARRRQQTQQRLHLAQLSQDQHSQRQQEARTRARQEEERVLMGFFGYTEQRLKDEQEERLRPKPTTPHMFSSVVSHMGHFPALPSSKPPAVIAAVAVVEPPPSFSQAAAPPPNTATAHGKKKKVPLYSNNPSDRRH